MSGATSEVFGSLDPERAYPRVSGATRVLLPVLLAAGGLSPRERGNQKLAFRLRNKFGPIPA